MYPHKRSYSTSTPQLAATATASIIILGEPLNAAIVVGISLTIAGLLLSQNTKRNKHARNQGV